jgi:micrococcal nuclease
LPSQSLPRGYGVRRAARDPMALSPSTRASPGGWWRMPNAWRVFGAGLIALCVTSATQAQPGVCRAIDGDPYVCFSDRIRVENIDSPELHAGCAAELDAALAAKLFAQHALDGALQIEIRIHERRPRDRYGRTLARAIVDSDDLGDLMIEAGLARTYHGERRRSWCE